MGTLPKAALCIFFQRAVVGDLPEVEELSLHLLHLGGLPEVEELSLHVLHLRTAVNLSQQNKPSWDLGLIKIRIGF